MMLAITVGISAGLWAALRRGKIADLISMVLATAGISLPVFWLALMLVLLLAVYLPLFPISGRLSTHIYFEFTKIFTLFSVLADDALVFFFG